MNVELYLWLEPLIMNHKRCNEKIFFYIITDNEIDLDEEENYDDDNIAHPYIREIMEFADIDSNDNFGFISACYTNQPEGIRFAVSPEKMKADYETAMILADVTPLEFSKENVEISEDGIIQVNVPSLMVQDKINFSKIWAILKEHISGKLLSGDIISLKNDKGEDIFEIRGGSFLNVGIAEIKVYNGKERSTPLKNKSFFDEDGLEGGLFVRDDGSLDIGDIERTFMMKINLDKLLKVSLLTNTPLLDIVSQKLLNDSIDKTD